MKLYTTDSNIAETVFEIVCLKKAPPETSVQLAEALRAKVVRCENAYSEEHTKGVFIDGLSANVQSAVIVF